MFGEFYVRACSVRGANEQSLSHARNAHVLKIIPKVGPSLKLLHIACDSKSRIQSGASIVQKKILAFNSIRVCHLIPKT